MQQIDAGWLSIIPPIVAIILALCTKEVIASLVIGIISGTLIYSGGNIISAIETLFALMSEKIFGSAKIINDVPDISNSNAYILIFLGLLGALVVIITMAGGSKAYGDWAVTKIKSRRGASLATFGLGTLIFIDDYFNCLTIGTVMRPVTDKHKISREKLSYIIDSTAAPICILGTLIFIDDYFNCLTIGTVMRPVTDKHKISREKLSYIIDSTAAPICIIAPISSWATAVGSIINDSGVENGLQVFIKTIPFNFYAILTIIMVIIICSSKNIDFGPMRKAELKCLAGESDDNKLELSTNELNKMSISPKGRVYDLCIPIGFLIISTLGFMLYSGGFFKGNISFAQAISDSNVNVSLVMGAFCSLILSFFLFVPRKLLTYKQFMNGIGEGVKSMVPAFMILILAWTMSAVCRELLDTGGFVGSLVYKSNIPINIFPAIKSMVPAFMILILAWTMSAVCRELLDTGGFVGSLVYKSNIPINIFPAIIFIVAAILAFAMGTSWGTFAILIPIVIEISRIYNNELLIVLIAATLGGSVLAAILAFAMGTSWGTFAILIPIVIEISRIYNNELLIVLIAATLGGSVLGDHCSPISDTTILASTGAMCNHIKHVSTQIIYTISVGVCCVIGYIIAGFTNSLLIPFIVSLLCLILFLVIIKLIRKKETYNK